MDRSECDGRSWDVRVDFDCVFLGVGRISVHNTRAHARTRTLSLLFSLRISPYISRMISRNMLWPWYAKMKEEEAPTIVSSDKPSSGHTWVFAGTNALYAAATPPLSAPRSPLITPPSPLLYAPLLYASCSYDDAPADAYADPPAAAPVNTPTPPPCIPPYPLPSNPVLPLVPLLLW